MEIAETGYHFLLSSPSSSLLNGYLQAENLLVPNKSKVIQLEATWAFSSTPEFLGEILCRIHSLRGSRKSYTQVELREFKAEMLHADFSPNAALETLRTEIKEYCGRLQRCVLGYLPEEGG